MIHFGALVLIKDFLKSIRLQLSLRESYIFALGIIAMITVQSHMLTAHITDRQKQDKEIAYLISSVRSHAQQISFFASAYASGGSETDMDLLELAITDINKDFFLLKWSINEKNLMGEPHHPSLQAAFVRDISPLNEMIEAFIRNAEVLSRTSTHEQDQIRLLAEELRDKATGSLNTTLDKTLQDFQRKTIAQAERYSVWQFWNMIIILTVLCLEAVFIFRPLVRNIERYQSNLRKHAFEDMLTGLNNRRAFIKRAEDMIKSHHREKNHLAVVLCDLDHFKSINDTYGHQAGDAVLQHYAELLQKSVRPGDITGRLGGEEFAIVLANTSLKGAARSVERLRVSIEKTPCLFFDDQNSVEIAFTASFGVIAAKEMNWPIEVLLDMADKNLYAAKEQGRNRVVASEAKTKS